MRVLYKRFGYINNVKIIYASKFLTGIGDYNIFYNPVEIYSNFEIFELEDFTNNNADLPSK